MFTNGFPQDKKITNIGMLWLVAAQIIVMLPLLSHLPSWIIPVLLFASAWRIRIMQGHLSQPRGLTKLILASLGVGGLILSGLPLVSLDMMAALLMLGFAYKSLEVVQQRDGMVVILTGYLLVGVQFVYSQSILSALYGVLSLAALTGAMIAIQQGKSLPIKSTIKLATGMLALCFPLMLLLFLFTPRFSPLWTVLLPSNHAKTGVSDQMTPGDIANLTQSDALAFRASFKTERPAQKDLYWRGLVLGHFDGKTWMQFDDHVDTDTATSALVSSEKEARQRLTLKGQAMHYEVIYEPSGQSWLFSLSPVVDIKSNAAGYGNDFRIMAKNDLLEPLLLKLTSYPQALRGVDLSASERALALQLPDHRNPQTKQFSQQLLASSDSTEALINKVLRRYRQENFYYTLRPPTLEGDDSIDDFLFTHQKGFCAHYAGSFVYIMRSASIPARVVVGYQGGTWNEKGDYLAVYQYDAHAWAEVWLKDKGWVRIDPTAMIAPERVEKNLQTAMQQEGSFLERQFISSAKYKWLQGIRQQIDATQYGWRKFVLGYDQNAQSNFMRKLFGEISMLNKVAWLMGGFFIAALFLWLLVQGLTKKNQTEAIEHQLYRRFCDLLEKRGIKREMYQSPIEYSRVAAVKIPHLAREIKSFSTTYSTLCYEVNNNQGKQALIARLKQLLKVIRR